MGFKRKPNARRLVKRAEGILGVSVTLEKGNDGWELSCPEDSTGLDAVVATPYVRSVEGMEKKAVEAGLAPEDWRRLGQSGLPSKSKNQESAPSNSGPHKRVYEVVFVEKGKCYHVDIILAFSEEEAQREAEERYDFRVKVIDLSARHAQDFSTDGDHSTPLTDFGEEKFTCPECGDDFASEHGLNVHISLVHGEEDQEPAVCMYCGEKFDSQRGLNVHMGLKHKDVNDES